MGFAITASMNSTRIGLISDVHAGPVAVEQALTIFKDENVSEIICAGDIAGYFDTLDPVVDQLIAADCKAVMGNHDQAFLQNNQYSQPTKTIEYLAALPQFLQLQIANKSIYVVHAHPPSSQHGGIKLLDKSGNIVLQKKESWEKQLQGFAADVLIVGHTHQIYAEMIGGVFVVNPGSSQFNHSCMILDLADLSVETYALEDQPILKNWNFSLLYGTDNRYPDAGL